MARQKNVVGATGADHGEEEDHRPGREVRQRGERRKRSGHRGSAAKNDPLARIEPAFDRPKHEIGDDQRDRHDQQGVAGIDRPEAVTVREKGAAPEAQHGDDDRIGRKPHQGERREPRCRESGADPAEALAQPFGRDRAAPLR